MNYSTPKPFEDVVISDSVKERRFNPKQTSNHEYVWHRDMADRTVTVLDGIGWKFQMDNELPISINKGDELYIPKMIFHRIIPGTTQLRIKIDEMVETNLRLAAI